MHLANAIDGRRPAAKIAAIDPFLDRDVGFRFQLQVSLFGVLAIIVFESTLDLNRMRAVAFDEVAVSSSSSTVRDQRAMRAGFQAPPKTGRFLGQFHGEIS